MRSPEVVALTGMPPSVTVYEVGARDGLQNESAIVPVEIKAEFVSADEREQPGGRAGPRSRAVLNYGHTLAHALETASHYELRHGEAVAIGLVFAARLARRLGRIDDDRVDEHEKVVRTYDLPYTLPSGADAGALVDLIARDKKAVEGFTFVLDGPRGVEVVSGVGRDTIEATLEEMR